MSNSHPGNKLPFRQESEKKPSEISIEELGKTDGRKIKYMTGLLQAQAGGIPVQPPMPAPVPASNTELEDTEGRSKISAMKAMLENSQPGGIKYGVKIMPKRVETNHQREDSNPEELSTSSPEKVYMSHEEAEHHQHIREKSTEQYSQHTKEKSAKSATSSSPTKEDMSKSTESLAKENSQKSLEDAGDSNDALDGKKDEPKKKKGFSLFGKKKDKSSKKGEVSGGSPTQGNLPTDAADDDAPVAPAVFATSAPASVQPSPAVKTGKLPFKQPLVSDPTTTPALTISDASPSNSSNSAGGSGLKPASTVNSFEAPSPLLSSGPVSADTSTSVSREASINSSSANKPAPQKLPFKKAPSINKPAATADGTEDAAAAAVVVPPTVSVKPSAASQAPPLAAANRPTATTTTVASKSSSVADQPILPASTQLQRPVARPMPPTVSPSAATNNNQGQSPPASVQQQHPQQQQQNQELLPPAPTTASQIQQHPRPAAPIPQLAAAAPTLSSQPRMLAAVAMPQLQQQQSTVSVAPSQPQARPVAATPPPSVQQGAPQQLRPVTPSASAPQQPPPQQIVRPGGVFVPIQQQGSQHTLSTTTAAAVVAPADTAPFQFIQKFCGDCGTKYLTTAVKFCGECGCKRI